jgi:hypothetical protein
MWFVKVSLGAKEMSGESNVGLFYCLSTLRSLSIYGNCLSKMIPGMVHNTEPYIKSAFNTAVYAAFNVPVSHDSGLRPVDDYIR